MSEDLGRLSFTAGIDNSQLERDAEQSKRILSGISQSAKSEGELISNSCKLDLSPLREFANEASSIFAMLGKEFDVSSVEGKVQALEEVISRNKAVVEELNAKFTELGASANETLANGDYQKFEELTLQMEQTATAIGEVTSETEQFSNVLASLSPTANDASNALNEVENAGQSNNSLLMRLVGGQEKYNALMQALPPGLQGVVKGIQGMTGAARIFIATPIGLILAAIAGALMAVKTAFTSTSEGQRQFAQVTGFVSGILGQLKEIVIKVGTAIINAFKNPKKAIEDLWQVIKENIVNRFKAIGDIASALGKVIKSAFTFNWDGVKEGLSELGESFLQFGTGIDNLPQKLANFTQGVVDAGKESASIAVEERDLERTMSKWQAKKEKLEGLKNDARALMYDTSLSQEERQKAIQDFEKYQEAIIKQEMAFIDKKIELQKRKMELTSNSDEDYEALEKLEAEKEKLIREDKGEKASLQRYKNRANDDSEVKAEEQRGQELLKIQEKNRQEEINAMADGSRKKIAQLRYNYDKEISELEKLEKKWKEAQGGKLTDAQIKAIETAKKQAKSKLNNSIEQVNKDEMEKVLSDILTYEQKRTKITEEYAQKRKQLYIDGDEAKGLREGISKANLDELNRQQEQALSAVDEQFASREDAYLAWCEQIGALSLNQLELVLNKAKEELEKAEKEGADAQQVAVARAKVEKAQKELSKKQSREEIKGPGTRTLKEWQDMYKTLNECVKSFDEMGDAIGGVAGEFVKSAGTIASSSLSMINGIVQLAQGSATAIQATSTIASASISTMEKASVILTVISSAIQIGMAIMKFINPNKARDEQIKALQTRIDTLSWELNNQSSAKFRRENEGLFKELREDYENQIAIYESEKVRLVKDYVRTTNIFNFQNNWKEFQENVSKLEEKKRKSAERFVENTARKFASIAYDADKILGTDKYQQIGANMRNLAQQHLAIQEQIEAEEGKRKGKKKEQIKEWQDKQKELAEQAVKMISEITEEIIGGTSSDIAKQLSDAFFEAFQNGEDYAKAWGDKVNDIVKSIVQRMAVNEFLEKPMAGIFDKYKKSWFKDSKFVGAEEVAKSMGAFSEELKGLQGSFASFYEEFRANLPSDLQEIFTSDSKDEQRQASASQGIAQASQESVDELNGRMTAVQGHTYSINENTKILVSTTGAILDSVLRIEGHTARLDKIEKTLYNSNVTLSNIALKGVKLRA